MYSFLRVCHALFNGRHTWQVFYMHTDTNVRMYTPLFTETQSDICGRITQQMILLTDLHALYELCAKMQIQLNLKPLPIISTPLFSMKFQFNWHLHSIAAFSELSSLFGAFFAMTSKPTGEVVLDKCDCIFKMNAAWFDTLLGNDIYTHTKKLVLYLL